MNDRVSSRGQSASVGEELLSWSRVGGVGKLELSAGLVAGWVGLMLDPGSLSMVVSLKYGWLPSYQWQAVARHCFLSKGKVHIPTRVFVSILAASGTRL